MKTEFYLGREKDYQASPWVSLVGLILLANVISAILRLCGAFQDQALLISYGVATWKINWLILSPIILIAINLLGWLFLWQRWRGYLLMAWLVFAVNFLSYWAERLLVWSPDQNLQGNLRFMLILFGAYLALMLLFTLDLKARDRN
jgi:hypothetical protein